MLKFFVISAFAKSYVSVDSRLYVYCLNDNSITQNPQAKLKKINDMCYIISALCPLSHSLESINPLMPRIAQTMSKNLAALIILESRFGTQMSSNTQQHSNKVQTILDPLTLLVRDNLIPTPKIPRYTRKIRSQYLLSCILSLQYWNRCLTYIRIFAYIVSFGKIKL